MKFLSAAFCSELQQYLVEYWVDLDLFEVVVQKELSLLMSW